MVHTNDFWARNVTYVCIFRYPYLLLKYRDLLLYDSGIINNLSYWTQQILRERRAASSQGHGGVSLNMYRCRYIM